MRESWILRRALGLYLLPGAIFGALTGLQDSSFHAGLFSGILFAVLFGGSMSLLTTRRTRRLGGLPTSERRQAMEIVRKGDRVTDPALAPAVIEYVAIVRRAQGKPRTVPLMTAGFLSLAAVVLIGALVSGHPGAIAADAIVFAAWAFNWFRLPRRREMVLERAALAEYSAHQALEQPGL
jgi:hypothetical protein